MATSFTGDTPNPRYLLLGEILRPHGVRGEIKMRLLTDYPERLKTLERVFLARSANAPDPRAYQIESVRPHQAYALIRLVEVPDRDAADRLRGMLVMVDIENAVPLEEGEFYLYQLLGLQVQTVEGELLGKMAEVLETGANDVYVVRGERYGEILIPATSHTIISTDIAGGLITVSLPEGLLPGQTETDEN